MFLALLAALATPMTSAQGRLGVGVIFGEPTGVSWKYKIDGEHALDGGIGLTPFDRFRIHVDYLWQSYPFQEEHLALHYGAGLAIGFRETVLGRDDNSFLVAEDGPGLGVRAVLGMTYMIPRSPVDLFLEVAPVFVLAPNAGIGFDAGFGARVYP
jgi:hypothetical protein